MSSNRWRCVLTLAVLLGSAPSLRAATVYVAAGGDLQKALDDAQPGDTILLAENAEFVGNFVLPVKNGDAWITLRSAAPDALLPAAGERIKPSHAPLLARLRSSNASAALRTAPGAHHWDIRYIDFPANQFGAGDIIQIGDGSSAQNTLAKVPHHIVLNHLYVHGDPIYGQKRGIALNGAAVTITDSHIADCKGIGQDTQAIGGWNGPGPYTIENNYLEGAGENVLFGGADPAIANLIADGITFRYNYLSRPMSWRDPIIPTPQAVTTTAVAGGSLPAGTYAYRVIARRIVGQGIQGRSTASAEVKVTTTATGAVQVRWQAVAGAAEYRVYGRTAGAQTIYWTVTGTEYVDTGASGSSESVPTSAGTVWSVKNIFELKNARNVVVENNVFENHWKESQPGYAIVFTPRNSNGTCTWCRVENVKFEYNILRNAAAGINLIGYDARPTRQSNNVAINHNVFRLSTTLGGNGWLMQIGDEPRDVTITHNTIDSNGSTLMYTYGGSSSDPREILGLKMIANASRHGSYGFNGASFGYGFGILNAFYPGYEFAANFLAGASLSKYPAGTIGGSSYKFEDQFVDPANGDYTVKDGSVLEGAAPDGTDIGADYRTLAVKTADVVAGRMPNLLPRIDPPTAIAPSPGFTVSCTFLDCVFVDASIAGTSPIASSVWSYGDGTQGTAAGAHSYAAAGTYTVSLTVADANGLSTTDTKAVTVEAALPPSADFTLVCTYLACAFGDVSQAGSRAIVGRSWNFGDGATGSEAAGTHTFAAAGTYTVALTVQDAAGVSSTTSKTVTVEQPNVAPAAAFTPSCVDLTCTFADNSTDVDGTVTAWAWAFGSSSSTVQSPTASFPAPGTYTVTLTVTDDDGAQAAVGVPVTVTGVLHAAYAGKTTKWSNASGLTHYWSAEVTVTVHGADERLVPGATVTAVWTGAVAKTVTCVANAAGACLLKSGTLSYGRSTVNLSVSSVVVPDSTYSPGASHDAVKQTNAFTLLRP